MEKILISLPDDLANKFRASIPARKRSHVIAELMRKELDRQDKQLMDCAKAVEKDLALQEEMKDWDITTGDGIKNEPW